MLPWFAGVVCRDVSKECSHMEMKTLHSFETSGCINAEHGISPESNEIHICYLYWYCPIWSM